MGEIITRRNLPHWYVPGAVHFITYRLAGSLPQEVILQLHEDRKRLLRQPLASRDSPSEFRAKAHKRLFAMYETHLDAGIGPNWLADASVAAIVRENLYHHDKAKYHLISYCIMPNHVHLLMQPCEVVEAARSDRSEIGETEDARSPLSKIMHSLKSYTANKANRLLGRQGGFWQHESYDHWVRNDEELERIVEYIRLNPVKAGLVNDAEAWRFSSAYDRFLLDGTKEGWLVLPSPIV